MTNKIKSMVMALLLAATLLVGGVATQDSPPAEAATIERLTRPYYAGQSCRTWPSRATSWYFSSTCSLARNCGCRVYVYVSNGRITGLAYTV